ncbi:single-stranded DNA-binding protein [Agromyces sp. NPDC055520]
MTDIITVTGLVGTDPTYRVTGGGLAITSFRLASTRRVFDRAKGVWEDGETNWYTVSAFRQLASNANLSVRKGQRLVVHGRLRLRSWTAGEKSGTSIEIEADSIGHDLAWCVTSYARVHSARPVESSAATASPGELVDGVTGEVVGFGGVGVPRPDDDLDAEYGARVDAEVDDDTDDDSDDDTGEDTGDVDVAVDVADAMGRAEFDRAILA